jgi:hypothetical protein
MVRFLLTRDVLWASHHEPGNIDRIDERLETFTGIVARPYARFFPVSETKTTIDDLSDVTLGRGWGDVLLVQRIAPKHSNDRV